LRRLEAPEVMAEARAVQRVEEPVSGAIAAEHASGGVAAGREADEQQRGSRSAEAGHATRGCRDRVLRMRQRAVQPPSTTSVWPFM
jgi:hypothetical protein